MDASDYLLQLLLGNLQRFNKLDDLVPIQHDCASGYS